MIKVRYDNFTGNIKTRQFLVGAKGIKDEDNSDNGKKKKIVQ